jgi:peptidoglycan/LPS O-acetylase OafA/YrhL
MPIELFGSFLVFAFCYSIVRRAAGLRIVLATAVITFFITEHFCLFFAGLAFAQLRQNGHFDKQRQWPFGRIAVPLLLLLCAAMDTLDYALNLRLNFTLPLVFRFHALLAVSIVYCIYCNSRLVCFFSNGISRWLGKVSFPLYLVHFSIICSLTSYLIIVARRTGELQLTQVLMIGTITVATAFTAAAVFARLERPTLRWVDHWVRKVLA